MATSTNIFKAGEEPTFAVSVPVFQKLLSSGETQASTVLLYTYLLSKAKGPLLRVHTGELLAETGLSRQTYINARDQLRKLNLITCEETAKQGVWQYELLGSEGGKLPTFADYIKFADLSASDLEAYYANRLGVTSAPDVDPNGNLKFHCPFHFSTKLRLRSLQVTINPGDGL